MAVTNFTGLTVTNHTVQIPISKVTDSSSDFSSVPNSTYFYNKADGLVYYKNDSGGITGMFVDAAFSPINIGSADTAPTAATTQYYYQTVAEITKTISKAKIWGYSGSDNVFFGIYRGTLSGSMTLIGQGEAVCGVGPNVIELQAQPGQTLSLTEGEDIVVGFYPDGTSFRTLYRSGISDANYAITNTSNIVTMPSTPTGTATAVRFALTLY